MTNGLAAVKFLLNVNPFVENYTMQEYEALKALVNEIETDVSKAEGGNKAAGTRVRKQMQAIKKSAQQLRSCILEIRSSQ